MKNHPGRYHRLLLILTLTALILPFTVAAQQNPSSQAAQVVDLRIMTFNIWVGGALVDFNRVVEAIESAEADIVGLQEPTGNTRLLAERLGWHYSERTHVVSRFPLIELPDADGAYVLAQIRPGEVVAVMNVHLPSDPYGPYAVRDGASLEEVLELERTTRLPAIEPFLAHVPSLLEAGIPVLLTGDFNAPSHRDWTEASVGQRPHLLYPVEWPVSLAVEAAGFRDTYRTIYPDPVQHPGITWTYGYPHPRLRPDEALDRIDLVFAAGKVDVLDSQIVGERNGPGVNIPVDPYPSDHRGVVSTIRVTPGIPPVFVAVEHQRIEAGEPFNVRYHAPDGEGTDRIAIFPANASMTDTPLMWLPPYEVSFFGSVLFGSGTLTPGEYAAVLLGEDNSERSRSVFWVVEPGAVPAVMTDRASYRVGQPITASWENAPGLRFDWLGIYAADDPDLYNNYLAFVYTGARVAGSMVFDADVLGEAMLPAGDYEVRLLLDDGYIVLASAHFTVTE
ncbi:MAG: endonuclease/exonuclease/phosphatase family protein [bacterium]|nr:endonuclease/exonuclease/phosphatase family protein [bacterium]